MLLSKRRKGNQGKECIEELYDKEGKPAEDQLGPFKEGQEGP